MKLKTLDELWVLWGTVEPNDMESCDIEAILDNAAALEERQQRLVDASFFALEDILTRRAERNGAIAEVIAEMQANS